MYYKSQNKYVAVWKFFLISSFLLMVIGCDSMLPEKFQDKTYYASPMDDQACSLLTAPDSLFDSLAYVINSPVLQSVLLDTSWLDSSDNKIIFTKFNDLVDTLPTLVEDQLMLVRYPGGKNITYAVLKVAAGQTKDLAMYISLNYYYDNETHTSNINEYVTIQLLKQDTTIVNSAVNMQGETLSDCTDEVLIASSTRIVPVIRSRDQAQLAEGNYIVRFILSDSQTISAFKPGTTARDYYFKLVIL